MTRLTPEEARALLDIHHPQDQDTGTEAESRKWGRTLNAIMKGPHSGELAQLTHRCILHPDDTAAHRKHEDLLKLIDQEIDAEIESEQ